MPRFVFLACLILAACGADGEPEKPSDAGITISGDAQVGVVMQ